MTTTNVALMARVRALCGKLPPFHLQMLFALAVVLCFLLVGCPLTSVHIPGKAKILLAFVAMVAAVVPLPVIWHEKGKIRRRDAALTIPWGLLFIVILPYTVDISGRLGMTRGLQDSNFAHADQDLGVRVPGLMAWASHHWLGNVADKSYGLLIPFILVALFLPSLTGRVEHAQRFVVANLVAFGLGLPLFAFLPAVGPWYGYHFIPSAPQTACQLSLFALRQPGPYVSAAAGVVCFPSFHVIWAVLSASALWTFRLLRVPVTVLTLLIILSTLTTGWHYFVDVLAGCAVAFLSVAAGRSIPA